MTNHPNLIMKLHVADVQEVDEWRRLDSVVKKLRSDAAGIQERFTLSMNAMGARLATFRSTPLVEMKGWDRGGLDTDRLKRERPEIYAEYQVRHVGEKAKYVAL